MHFKLSGYIYRQNFINIDVVISIWSYFINLSFVFVDEYSVLDGKWETKEGSLKSHSSLLKAKRHCSNEGKCFGIEVNAIGGAVYSINFPIRLIQQQQGDYYIHKKEHALGNIVYHEC